jgi:hypothetical protein
MDGELGDVIQALLGMNSSEFTRIASFEAQLYSISQKSSAQGQESQQKLGLGCRTIVPIALGDDWDNRTDRQSLRTS